MIPAAAELHDAAALNSPDLASPILDLTVFVSCYNGSQYIANTLDNVRTALAELGKFVYEIVVIDDCSTDESPRAILDYLNRYPYEGILFRRNLVNIGWAQNYIDAAFIGCGKFFRVVCGDESEPKQTMIDVFNCIGDADILVPYYASSEGRSLPLSLNNVSGLHHTSQPAYSRTICWSIS
jgi:glycosyltransferase involved in cell wall biosynthesis